MHDENTEQGQWPWRQMRGQEAGSGLSSSGAFPGQVWVQVPCGPNLLIGLRRGHSTLAWAISRRGSRGVNDFLCFSEADQGGGQCRQHETTWFTLPCRGSHSQPERCQEMRRPSETLRWWQYLSPWGFLPESSGDAFTILAQAILRGTDRKGPSEFSAGPPWSRTIAKDKGRPEKHSDLQ